MTTTQEPVEPYFVFDEDIQYEVNTHTQDSNLTLAGGGR